MWQLGSLHVNEDVYRAAELVIGNLNEEGYLIATDDELLGLGGGESVALAEPVEEAAVSAPVETAASDQAAMNVVEDLELEQEISPVNVAVAVEESRSVEAPPENGFRAASRPRLVPPRTTPARVPFGRDALREAIDVVKQMDPIGVGARDLRECLLAQLQDLKRLDRKNGNHLAELEALDDATILVDKHLHALQNKHYKEVAKVMGRPLDAIMRAMDFIRTLDPRPGLRYNKTETRLIEPDVAFVKQGDEYLVLMNDEEVPQLRLNPAYRKLLSREAAEKDVRNYVKERYKSAIQLIKNIEQRKQTILRVCYSILERQRDFLDHGIDLLKPMMIKEVAE
jgi:RNA polymerase sigma-54 factor